MSDLSSLSPPKRTTATLQVMGSRPCGPQVRCAGNVLNRGSLGGHSPPYSSLQKRRVSTE